ncbi:alpha/beta hydrolase family protein [Paenibacillus oceani]|uniref:Fungal lipase-like domain-containing protein n=1 Tax=Paenibacillus oceani TaxID=2772510 RepID=A0A927H0I4_9BACL|nr:hypothetical protein [Paenibacillus oceani]MBD2863177.1 hypothetical protein [Paenibacillus oceani]
MRKLSIPHKSKAAVYVAAGVYTSPNFMEGVLKAVVDVLEREPKLDVVGAGLLFPYGDWSCPLLPQIRQVYRDMTLRSGNYERSLGGGRILSEVGSGDEADILLFIGHSGGGVASVHAASLLDERLPAIQTRIVQIGCPRFAIPPVMCDRVRYLYAAKANGSGKDPITRIGSWGGWEKGAAGVPRWNPLKFAPDERIPVPLLGGHADYFRNYEPFRCAEGHSNLDLVLEKMLEGWLR